MVIKPSTWQRMDWELLGNSVNSVSLSLLSAGEEIMIEVINAICFIAILLNHSHLLFGSMCRQVNVSGRSMI